MGTARSIAILLSSLPNCGIVSRYVVQADTDGDIRGSTETGKSTFLQFSIIF